MSAERPFVHLHCHSHYSLLDGASRIPELVQRVKGLGMNAVALTDHGNLYGAIELYKEATAAGIKPIVGYEAYVAPGPRTSKENRGNSGEASFHLTLLAKNHTGYKNLIKMASKAFLEGFYYKPRIDKELLEAYHEGIICLSGCAASEFSSYILKEQMTEARRTAEWFARLFGEGNFFIEIQNNALDIQRKQAEGAIDLANQLGLPLVVTSDAHYLCQEDADVHDVLLCINTKRQRSDPNRMKYGSNQFYVRGPQEMYAQFPDHAEAVKRSQEIADKCELQLDFKKRYFPVFKPPEEKTTEEYLRDLCEQGMCERYGENPPQAARDRLEHELKIINKLGFASYFLIVWDFVRFARESGIPAGARGSACGAIVSYLLHLSNVCPLEYHLLFERFLDPNRAEAPDIDIDFCQDRREKVIEYVRQKYGAKSVAQIGTFGTLAAKAAVKDVGRVLGIELARTDQVAKLIPAKPGTTLDDAMAEVPDFKKLYDTDGEIREVVDIARKLEGTNRNLGTHAAGVVIANGDLTDYVPLHWVKSKDDETGETRDEAVISTQWTMEDLEKVGLLKMDFLGLRTLTVIDKCLQLIKQNHGVDLDLIKLPLDDPASYDLFHRGQAQGVFQVESEGMQNLLQRMRPDNIGDLIASIALYRPGPLGGGMVDMYINCKHGKETPTYEHPVMEEILHDTHGVMCYQEQIMQILNRLGGIELSSAYACIKAISKKKQEIIDKRHVEFVKGAVEKGVSEKTAEDIFSKIVFFGGYGFNRSHSAAYGLVCYQTAYLKSHYPNEFLAAVLTSEIGKTDKLVPHLESARRAGRDVLPPDVNTSEADFSVKGDRVQFGLAAIRGLGRKPAEAIVVERKGNGPFRDLFDFCERVDQKLVSKGGIELLIKSGAFDVFGSSRAAMVNALPGALQAAAALHEDRRRGQRNIFDLLDEAAPQKADAEPRKLAELPEWPDLEKLAHEKDALGFYVSSHPLANRGEDLRYATHTVADIARLKHDAPVMLGGMLSGIRFLNAKKSRSAFTRMARGNIEDLTGAIEWVIFPDNLAAIGESQVKDEHVCFVEAQVDKSEYREKPGLIINKIIPLDQGKRDQTKGVKIKLLIGQHPDAVIPQIGKILRRAPGRIPVYLEVLDGAGKRAVLRLGEQYAVDLTKFVASDLDMLLGVGHVQFVGPAANGRAG